MGFWKVYFRGVFCFECLARDFTHARGIAEHMLNAHHSEISVQRVYAGRM
jgi:hypothetical protein